MSNNQDNEQNSDTSLVELGLEGLAHGFFVELPAGIAGVIDWASDKVNQAPTLWGGTPFASYTLTYADDVHHYAQTVYDAVNGWTGYIPPVPSTNTERVVYGASELAGQYLLPTGLAFKGTAGLMGTTSLSQLANPSFLLKSAPTVGKGVLKVAWDNKLLTGALIADGTANDFGVTKWAGENIVMPVIADVVHDGPVAPMPGQDYGHREPATPEQDSYHSILDTVESNTGWDIPDDWEEKLHDGLGWLGEGSWGSKIALGLVTLFGSNMIIGNLMGNNAMSGLISVGLAVAAAVMGPSLLKQFNASSNGQTKPEVEEKPQSQLSVANPGLNPVLQPS
ncbi:MAG: hypothetical protein H6869_09005 [Rhodospirillales bacterium]|nr:hypothetical protein [Rhodospirillales bacterium]